MKRKESIIDSIVGLEIRLVLFLLPLALLIVIVLQVSIRTSESFRFATEFVVNNDSLRNEIGVMNGYFGLLIGTDSGGTESYLDDSFFFTAHGTKNSVHIACTVRSYHNAKNKFKIVYFKSRL